MTPPAAKHLLITEEELDCLVNCASKEDCSECKYSKPEFECTPLVISTRIRARSPAPDKRIAEAIGKLEKMMKHTWSHCTEIRDILALLKGVQ